MACDPRRSSHTPTSQTFPSTSEQGSSSAPDESKRRRSQSEALSPTDHTFSLSNSSSSQRTRTQAAGLPKPPSSFHPSDFNMTASRPSSLGPPQAPSQAPSQAQAQTQAQPIVDLVDSALDGEQKSSHDPELVKVIAAEVMKKIALEGMPTTSSSVSSLHMSGQFSDRDMGSPPSPGYVQPTRAPQPVEVPIRGTQSSVENESAAARRYRPDISSSERPSDTTGPPPNLQSANSSNLSSSSASSHATPHLSSGRSQSMDEEPFSDATIMEKAWRPLFTAQGEPTGRLGQFLRGLASYIIEEFEPKNSLVIHPSKMLMFYKERRVACDVVPWNSIFGQISTGTLSHLYRDLRCEHHFVQPNSGEKPSLPALTPKGFEVFVTIMIRAYPDVEYERFAQVAKLMPINNPEDAKERFPKELSRRLFPRDFDPAYRRSVEDVIYERTREEVRIPRISNMAPQAYPQSAASAPAAQAYSSQSTGNASNISGPPSASRPIPTPAPPPSSYYRQPQSGGSADYGSSFDADSGMEDLHPVGSIERERKPYAAAPGGGKVYGDDFSRRGSENTRSHGPQRANSTASSSRPINLEPPDPNGGYRSSVRPRSDSQSNKGLSRNSASRPRSLSSHNSQARSNIYTRSETEIPFGSGSGNIPRDDDGDLRKYHSHNPEDRWSRTAGNFAQQPSTDQYRRNPQYQQQTPPRGEYGRP